ncbi:MAG: urease accessory protein [Pseudomonadota bacterium]
MGLSVLLIGFALGMRHALDADHLVAVATLAGRASSPWQAVRHGAVWGLGHTLTLCLFGAVILSLGSAIPDHVAIALELCVALMLIVLGLDLLRRIFRDRVHFHAHTHGDDQAAATRHFHAHSHAGEGAHVASDHRHEHPEGIPRRALLVGIMHGMAGSAALIFLALDASASVWHGMLYIALFGVGSIIGMASLSLIIALPMRFAARSATGLYNGLQAVIALSSVSIGVWLAAGHSTALMGG